MNYTRVVVFLKDILDEPIYLHFLIFFCAYRLIANPATAKQNVDTARNLFKGFVEQYPKVYGAGKVSFNVHNLLHICDYVELYGSVDSFSAYEFENFMQEIKSAVRKPQQILKQIYNRFIVMSRTNEYCKPQLVNPIKDTDPFPGCHSSYGGYKFDEFVLMNNETDGCCRVSDEKNRAVFIEISAFSKDQADQITVIGRRYLSVASFFEKPINSLKLGIVFCKNLSVETQRFSISKIIEKFYRMPHRDGFVLVPLLHWQRPEMFS
jgi:hypothetical protein